jgi:predicted Co/Zn/Cd cation transporter (cation efflux family)
MLRKDGTEAATLVTLPDPLLLKVVQSVEVKYPFTAVVAAGMARLGVAPPDDVMGAVAPTEVT